MYHDPHQAESLLHTRRHLRSEVEAWWQSQGWGIPDLPQPNGHQLAVFARHVATFRYEDALFVLLAERGGLEPVWLEYTADRFADVSPYKHSLGSPTFATHRGRSGGLGLKGLREVGFPGRKSLIHFNSANGRPINQISLVDGRPLVDFHHEHQDRMMGGRARRFDLSTWLQQIGKAKDYYAAYLSLFVAHLALFEDYHGGESAGQDGGGGVLFDFTSHVFEPAWQEVVDRFGVEPLLVKMPWHDFCRFFPLHPDWRENGVILPEHLEVN